MPDLSEGEFKKLHGKLGSDGGFTVNPRTGVAVSSGISVAPAGNEMRIPAGRTTPGSLASYHGDPGNQERFTRGASFGGWRSENSGDDFIDTPTVYQNSAGGQSRARNQMLKSNQISAYDIDRGETLLNPFHSENKSLDVVSSDDSPVQKETWREMPRRATKGKKITPSEGMSFS
jgi:hypothetical protein